MSATNTALKLIEWAIQNQETVPPLGDLSGAEKLAHPSKELIQAMEQLTVVTAARLRWQMPPLGDNRPIGVENIMIAAGLGSANPQLARRLLQAVTKVKSYGGDWVFRYGLITPALPFLQTEIADDCRELSPLTTVLNYPIPGQEALAVDFVLQLLKNSSARLSLILHLAKPTTNIKIRDWRSELMERLRRGKEKEQSFVIDVYEAAMIYHQSEVINQVKNACTIIKNPNSISDELLQDALSIAKWWQSLWAIEREDVNLLRQRRYLNYAYREGIKLFKLSRKMMG